MTNNEILKQKQAQIFAGACAIAAGALSDGTLDPKDVPDYSIDTASLIHLKVYGMTPAFQCDHGIPLSVPCGFCKRTEEPVEKVGNGKV